MRALGMPKVFGFYGLMAAVALAALWGRDSLDTILPTLAAGTWPTAWAIALGAGLGVGGIFVLCSRVITARFAWAAVLAQEFRALLGVLGAREAALLALCSGVGEELLFRGVLQPGLGLWLGAAVFGVLHIGPNRRFLPWTVMAFVVGLAFGALFLWTGSLLAPIVAHGTVNYFNLRALTRVPPAGEEINLGPVGGEGTAEM